MSSLTPRLDAILGKTAFSQPLILNDRRGGMPTWGVEPISWNSLGGEAPRRGENLHSGSSVRQGTNMPSSARQGTNMPSGVLRRSTRIAPNMPSGVLRSSTRIAPNMPSGVLRRSTSLAPAGYGFNTAPSVPRKQEAPTASPQPEFDFEDAFKKYHASRFDPNSSRDRELMQQLKDLYQESGGNLTPSLVYGRQYGKSASVLTERRFPRLFQMMKSAALDAADGYMGHSMQRYLPVAPRRELSEDEKARIERRKRMPLPKIFKSLKDQPEVDIASPWGPALLLSLLGAVGGAGAGSAIGGAAAAGGGGMDAGTGGKLGAGIGALLGGLGLGAAGYHGMKAHNENIEENMRRIPEGGTRRDLLSDPVYQAGLDRSNQRETAALLAALMRK